MSGIYRLLAPSNPFAEAAVGVGALPPSSLPAPDFHLARVAPGQSVSRVRSETPWARLGVSASSISDPSARDRRSLTGLSLDGLGTLEAVAAVIAASLGVGVLGAFVVSERSREFAALRALGVERGRLAAHPLLEMAGVLGASVFVGLPLGIGLAAIAVRVMPLFFVLPPTLVIVPLGSLAWLVLAVVLVGSLLAAGALVAAVRSRPAALLRG